jgi:hypothetical protein
MDEGTFWLLGAGLGPRLMRYGVVFMAATLDCLAKPEWPTAVMKLRADYVTEKMQSAIDRLLDDQRPSARQKLTPVSSGRGGQLRRDMQCL